MRRSEVDCTFCLFSVESQGLAADAYSDALEGCKKTAKKVEEKFVAKMQECNVRVYVYAYIYRIQVCGSQTLRETGKVKVK